MTDIARIIEMARFARADPIEFEVVLRILEFLSDNKGTTHVSMQLVRQLTPDALTGKLDGEILRSLQFLSGDSVRILETRFELAVDEDTIVDLDDEQTAAAIIHHIDPLTGEIDPAIEDRLMMYFSPLEKVNYPEPFRFSKKDSEC